MKIYSLLFLLFVGLSSCKQSAAGNIHEQKNKDTITVFTLPQIPAMFSDPEQRADFLVKHYWDHFNFADTNYIHHPEISEQAWVTYIDLLDIVPQQTAVGSLQDFLEKAEMEKNLYLYFITLAEKYLYDPNSPMRNEELYIPVLDAMLDTSLLSELEKVRPQARRELAERNRPGRLAENFVYTLSSGKKQSLHEIKSEFTLLFINNPGCDACEESINSLKASSVINQKIAARSLQVLALYPDEDLEEWKRHQVDFPSTWINAYDQHTIIKEKNLYDLKAIPTLYLLDEKKQVLLKDATVADVDRYLADTVF